jgi:uncharacterized protein YidB (DUF937 family)
MLLVSWFNYYSREIHNRGCNHVCRPLLTIFSRYKHRMDVMGLLDQVIGNVLGSRGGGQGLGQGSVMGGGGGGSPLMMALMALLGSRGMGGSSGLGGMMGGMLGGGGMGGAGGLGGLLQQFQSSGHGDKFQSWVGPGENHSIAPHELEEALGPDQVEQLASQTGMPRGDMLKELSHVLPGAVHELTPQGRLPNDDEMRHW